MRDELEQMIAEGMKNPEFRRGWYRAAYSAPLPLKHGAEYRRRRRRR